MFVVQEVPPYHNLLMQSDHSPMLATVTKHVRREGKHFPPIPPQCCFLLYVALFTSGDRWRKGFLTPGGRGWLPREAPPSILVRRPRGQWELEWEKGSPQFRGGASAFGRIKLSKRDLVGGKRPASPPHIPTNREASAMQLCSVFAGNRT